MLYTVTSQKPLIRFIIISSTQKLNSLGVSTNLFKHFRSYLADHFIFVNLLGHNSNSFAASTGVSQGSNWSESEGANRSDGL